MARWRRDFLREVTDGLGRLGLSSCPVCGGSELQVLARPRLLLVGGRGARGWLQPPDADETIEYLVAVRCSLCGHQLLFDAEQYRHGDGSLLVRGDAEEETAPGEG
ncbi:hypothetical protein ACQPX6_13680 [Actinomycetospora sp. CA-101289]|uniref:hypothetical protein n=1 Tax=Actinomycetospora sp. CA-101289 TaxID=3239893 RepID=UPI003D969E31